MAPSQDKSSSIEDLMSKYLGKSREPSEDVKSRDDSPSINDLLKRYSNVSTHSIKDAVLSRRSSTVEKPEAPAPLTEARLSGSDVRIKWEVSSKEVQPSAHVTRFSVTIDPGRMPIGGSNSRTGRLARISQSNIRPFGSNGGTSTATTFGPGSHPMAEAEPSSPTKTQPKHRFEITKKLGSGTYGKVSLAYDHKFDREVAVKLIKKSAIENKADLVRIRREIRIMSALNHPNIIQIYEVFENKDKIILVMEYSSGGELYDYVSRCGSLPECEARRIFRQITSAVLYCHKHKVAHRDLKLENILLDQDNNAKIADFGLSNYFSDKNLLATFCGSPLYASPEIINGTPYRGPEVDCWSLGILLYTLVYGSMPFDGRDFNRMVRQIKRGAYYEPEQPSTASMLIRNMLRVNPDRRANIFDIASHWWLNLEENMPVIQELPENQIIDHTPLTERAETMVVQDLADEQDVFMEFGHLSNETRKKIEDFRRRRKEAEEFNENSPVKPPKKKKENDVGAPVEELRAVDKSLRGKEENPKVDTNDPLERLRQIETRLGQSKKDRAEAAASEAKKKEEVVTVSKKKEPVERKKSPEQPEDPKTAREPARKASDVRAPSFVPVTEPRRDSASSRAHMSASAYRIETDSLNMLMNQVLEQMEKGPVNLNIVARIKAHPLYDTRPMVKELLESIISAQSESVKRQTSKVIEKTVSRNNTLTRRKASEAPEEVPAPPSPPTHERRHQMGVRPWNSVEVGFDPEDDNEPEVSVMAASIASTATEVTVQDTSFEDSDDDEVKQKTPVPASSPKTPGKSDSATDDEDEYSDSEMEELADEVEKKNPEAEAVIAASLEANPPPDPSSSPQYLDAFDRRLIKRQSKGKYQHTLITNYGRGVSTECESPTQQRKFFGGPQPSAKLSPYLFDKAKELVMQYPKIESKLDLEMRRKKKMEKVKADLLAQPKESDKPRTIYVGSVPPRTPPPIVVKSDGEDVDDDEDEEDEEMEEEEEEESETEVENIRPRRAIIAAVRTDDGVVHTPASTSTTMAPYKPNYQVPTPDGINSNSAKYLVTVAELRLKPTNGNEELAKREEQLKEELKEAEIPSYRKTSQPRPSGYFQSDLYKRVHAALERPSVERYDDRSFSPAIPEYTGYTRTRYEDSFNRPTSPTSRYVSAAVSREERGKSQSNDHDYRSAYDRTSYMAPNASPSYGRKFDEPTSLNAWASEPRRFEVYKTRAERDAERNTSTYAPAPASSYKTNYYSDRPVSTIGLRAAARADDYSYRSNTPGTNDYGYAEQRFRPSARRVSSALTEADKRAYSRSRSMDRNKAEEYIPRNRLTTPDAPDYSYVNYHDTAIGRTGSMLEKDGQPRGILKNKQTSDLEPRADYESTGGVRSMFDRLRRHLSLEKSTSPQRQVTNAPPTRTSLGSARDSQTPTSSDNPKKKRSLLSFNRRKTSEVRLGSDGKFVTNGYDEPSRDYNRPSSPIDRIKSFFRKSDAPTTSTQYEYSRGYPTSSISTSREPYIAQYRKYPGSSSARDPVSSYNRYSYTPGLSDQRRHWYDDPGNY